MAEQMLSYIQIDELKTKALPHQEENAERGTTRRIFHPTWVEINGERYPVWTANYSTAIQHVTARPDRWKLFRCDSVPAKVMTSTGSVEWQTIYPWNFRSVRAPKLDGNGQQMTDKENDELLFETKLEWYEDKDQKNSFGQPTNGVASGVVRYESDPKVPVLEAEVARLKKEVAELEAFKTSASKGIQVRDATIKRLREKAGEKSDD
jgi:hypothetical protein